LRFEFVDRRRCGRRTAGGPRDPEQGESGAAGQYPPPADRRADNGRRAWHSNILPLL
jgi:hypothetical protein